MEPLTALDGIPNQCVNFINIVMETAENLPLQQIHFLRLQNTHVVLNCRRFHSPETQIYTDNQHLARSRPERGTAGTPLGWSLHKQMGAASENSSHISGSEAH